MKPIYRKKSYPFSVQILVNNIAPDITADTVTVTIDKTLNTATPSIEKDADVLTSGATGKAIFELDLDDTDLSAGLYYLQVIWKLVGGTREFVVIDEEIEIKETVEA